MTRQSVYNPYKRVVFEFLVLTCLTNRVDRQLG